MSEILLSTKGLACERDDRLLFSELSLDIKSGHIYQVKGPNGAGKTTLLRCLAGLYQNYSGQVSWLGEDIRNCFPSYHSELLFLGHKSSVKTTLTVLENLRFLTGLKQVVSDDDLYNALHAVGLRGYEDVLCQNLSAGQHRRVGLARLFLTQARLWILDEAFTAIDLNGVSELELFFAAKAESGTAIVLTTHHRLAIQGVNVIELDGGVHA